MTGDAAGAAAPVAPAAPMPGIDADALLAWGQHNLRDLPWRSTRDPWAVLVSEVMAQQTQVARVVPAWHAFLAAFPTPQACAAAPLGEILRRWHGLGYPRRARDLHAAAGRIAARGAFPDELGDLLALPGVGPYTARAVLAFAFEADVGLVDTNIARVLARWSGRRLTSREVQHLADSLVPAGHGWAWNQSLMELGARLCRPRPQCGECPLVAACAYHGDGPDPAAGSAKVSTRQGRFDGSDRQARGRLMAALQRGPVSVGELATILDRPADEAQRLAGSLVSDGLCVRHGDRLDLP